ncbi:MAG TPA: hypothetical protein VE360_09630 [Pyrinomonadaceae bacterium]|nr:hypothetical protein [Pyrinomonadaceae bacterium]
MNEQTRDAIPTNDATRARGCDRAEDLVAYLYGEATPAAGASFARHLHACAVCRDELAAFNGVRELVGAERAAVLGAAPALDVDELMAPAVTGTRQDDAAHEAASPLPSRGRSAVAAFREFFALSPLWLRAGAVACVALVCALSALTLARAEVRWDADGFALRTGGAERVVEKRVEVPVPTGFTQEQVDALVAQRLKEERASFSTQLQQAREAGAADAAAPRKKSAPRVLVAGDAPRTQPRRRGATNNARRDDQLLAEDDLPRLSDLLGGAY